MKSHRSPCFFLKRAVVSLYMLLSATSCSQSRFTETNYVGVLDKKSGAMQFYRFELRGDPGLNRVKFVTAWYDADAIERMVGERGYNILTTDLGFKGETPPSQDSKSSKPTTYYITGPEGGSFPVADKRLTIIMSSDPKPIIKFMKSLLDDKDFLQALKKMLEEKRKPDAQLADRLYDWIQNNKDKYPSLSSLAPYLDFLRKSDKRGPNDNSGEARKESVQ